MTSFNRLCVMFLSLLTLVVLPLYLFPLFGLVTLPLASKHYCNCNLTDGKKYLVYEETFVNRSKSEKTFSEVSESVYTERKNVKLTDFVMSLQRENLRLQTLNNETSETVSHLQTLITEKNKQLELLQNIQNIISTAKADNEDFKQHLKEENTNLKSQLIEKKEEIQQLKTSIAESAGTSVLQVQSNDEDTSTYRNQCDKLRDGIQTIIKKHLKNHLITTSNRRLLREFENVLKGKPVEEKLRKSYEEETFEPELEVSPYPEAVTRPKLVHLDLKGAPPKLDYILWFMRFVKQFGAGGLLIEYEDMFPWSGDLKVIASKHAFTTDDIKTILKVAKEENLMIIPLIQSFGHLQFLLKHEEFETLRADKTSLDSISAYNPQSVPIIKNMIDQIVELHPDIEWLHIGGDEVYNMEKCDGCSEKPKQAIFLHHMTPLLKYVKSKNLKPIIWDDMFRSWSLSFLSEMKGLVTPMLWQYNSNLASFGGYDGMMFKRYGKVFGQVWVASAFKGALQLNSNYVPIRKHVDNNVAWLDTMQRMKRYRLQTLGMALTGWSRYWHGAPLCELLPVGIPSLAICLETLKNGGFNDDIHSNVSQALGFHEEFYISSSEWIDFTAYKAENASYNGASVYHLVGTLETSSTVVERYIYHADELTLYNTEETSNLKQKAIKATLKRLQDLTTFLKQFQTRALTVLNTFYDNYVSEEWVGTKISPLLERINGTTTSLQTAYESMKKKEQRLKTTKEKKNSREKNMKDNSLNLDEEVNTTHHPSEMKKVHFYDKEYNLKNVGNALESTQRRLELAKRKMKQRRIKNVIKNVETGDDLDEDVNVDNKIKTSLQTDDDVTVENAEGDEGVSKVETINFRVNDDEKKVVSNNIKNLNDNPKISEVINKNDNSKLPSFLQKHIKKHGITKERANKFMRSLEKNPDLLNYMNGLESGDEITKDL